MPTYAIVIGIYPTTPTSGPDFTLNYLTGLSITAYQVDFEHPDPAASVEPPGNLIGTATYPNNIYQLIDPSPLAEPTAAAGAVIDIPAAMADQFVDPAGDQYTTPTNPLINVVLSVERNGTAIADNSVNYDVNVWEDTGLPIDSLDGVTVGLYLGLGPAGTELGNVPYLQLTPGGGPPSYTDLNTVINEIIIADPGAAGPYDPANLTAPQCLHLAREIVSNRTANPLPAPSPDLGSIYTGSPGDGNDQHRQQFSSALQAYYASLDSQATTLAQYIAAWSAAQNCAAATTGATSAGFTFPVRLTSTPSAGQAAQATVILHN
jgi:hypothetical protein